MELWGFGAAYIGFWLGKGFQHSTLREFKSCFAGVLSRASDATSPSSSFCLNACIGATVREVLPFYSTLRPCVSITIGIAR